MKALQTWYCGKCSSKQKKQQVKACTYMISNWSGVQIWLCKTHYIESFSEKDWNEVKDW